VGRKYAKHEIAFFLSAFFDVLDYVLVTQVGLLI
jgi:hypothetical protein